VKISKDYRKSKPPGWADGCPPLPLPATQSKSNLVCHDGGVTRIHSSTPQKKRCSCSSSITAVTIQVSARPPPVKHLREAQQPHWFHSIAGENVGAAAAPSLATGNPRLRTPARRRPRDTTVPQERR
jgi:hypothetical protein